MIVDFKSTPLEPLILIDEGSLVTNYNVVMAPQIAPAANP